MKRKPDPLEALLRRPEASVPRGLRSRALQRMGLRPAQATWSFRPWAAGASLAGALALAWVLNLSYESGQPQAVNATAPVSVAAVAAEATAQAVAGQAKSNPAPGQEQAAQEAPAIELARQADAEAVSPPAPSKAAASSAPAALLTGSGQPLVQRALTAAPGTAAGGTRSSESMAAAHGHDPLKSQTPQPYRLTVKGNRLRPALNERVKLELQLTRYGRVQAGVYSSQGQLLRKLADLNDPVGIILLEWDGRLADGQDAPSGAYTLLIQSPDKTEKVGVLVIR